ncbi:MAG: sulfate adenylyltransferase [Acidobacteria bacterium]|nr:sulfate adenylyltransferase [Acidobacteriota bacterium]
MFPNRPHGGRLVNRIASECERQRWLERMEGIPSVQLNPRQMSDLELVACGAFSPLEGFLGSRDYQSVLECERLASGLVWTIPVTLAVSEETAQRVRQSEHVALRDGDGHAVAVLHLDEVFRYDREQEAARVLQTTSDAHPGVRYLRSTGDFCLAGSIDLLQPRHHDLFANHLLDPRETRYLFEHRGWRSIAAFQTRNPIHRAHEYILKCALETVDGLLVHPLVGETREEDLPAEVRLHSYLAAMKNSMPAGRAVLSLYPAAMRYAGPREAIFHALARKNYGCTHFIVGRDHAGVGNFYGPYDAQTKFFQFDPAELGITPICFEATFYCGKCGHIASSKTCPHTPEDRLSLSGTQVREMLRNGLDLPPELTRPEVAEVLRDALNREEPAENPTNEI